MVTHKQIKLLMCIINGDINELIGGINLCLERCLFLHY